MTTEFKITGPGEYRTRDGRKAVVKGNNSGGSYCWNGKIGEEDYDWTEYGSYWNKGIISVDDIISPWEEPATVSSVLTYAGITKKPSEVLTWLDFVQVMNTPEAPTCENCGAKKTVVGGTIRADGIGERTDYACLNCTCGKCGKKKTMKLNIDYGNGSREIVYSCTNCNRPPVSADPWGTSRAVLMSLVQYYDITGEYKIRNKRQVEIFIKYLKDKGYSIVRTDSLSDNRNGCYNTRTDHRIQRRLR